MTEPPVVPDSDPFGPLSDEDRRRMREFGASGSGVVPDKPALAPATDEALAAGRDWAGDIASTFGWSVPAVTDDEAAEREMYSALTDALVKVRLDENAVFGSLNFTRRVVTRLRSAGFLIVHHTKET